MLKERTIPSAILSFVGLGVFLAGCAGTGTRGVPAVAVGAKPAMACDALVSLVYPQLEVKSATIIAAGQQEAAGSQGQTVSNPEYCKIAGALNKRTSPIDGKAYAIGFEMRLPTAWNGRFFYQANGGLDGFVTPAVGDILGGGQAASALTKGFAVLSSDAGHADSRATPISGGLFGIDPQARLDYGYNAVGSLTPMAKSLIRWYYGKAPERSYLVGTSNGGRHAMVAASRIGEQYDGYLVSAPGFNLPKAAAAQLWSAQQFATISPSGSNGRPDIARSFSPDDTRLIAARVLARCDGLDGIVDGIVADTLGCQRSFDPAKDIPVCAGAADGTCLTASQKDVLAKVFAGATMKDGKPLYAAFPWTEGIHNNSPTGWRAWKFVNATAPRDPLAMAFVFMTPPFPPAIMNGTGTTVLDFALNWNDRGFNVERDASRIFATDGIYTESAMSFMTPPDPAMNRMVNAKGKMIVVHGVADPVFSALDTLAWYERFLATHSTTARDHARLFLIPGMGHSRGGPSTDQADFVEQLVDWVERGVAPESVVATARGKGGRIAPANDDVPASWSPNRTRLLCAYPLVPRYNGSGDSESAASFRCQ